MSAWICANEANDPVFPSEMGDKLKRGLGLSLRDWFASVALHGWLSGRQDMLKDGIQDDLATDMYIYADAMLKAREKQAD